MLLPRAVTSVDQMLIYFNMNHKLCCVVALFGSSLFLTSLVVSVIVEGPVDTYGLVNQRITLHCKIKSADPINVTWHRNSSQYTSSVDELDVQTKLTGYDRYISTLGFHLTESKEGRYYCNVTSLLGWQTSQNAFVLIAFLDMTFTLVPVDKTVSIGETVLLECLPPRGLPKPIVRWEKNNSSLALGERIQLLGEGSLRIDKVTWKDAGHYVCVAESSSFRRHSPSAYLSVHRRPYFIVSPASVSVPIHGSFELSCIASGEPLPVVLWRREPHSPAIPYKRSKLMTHGSLHVKEVQLQDAGEYICRATNNIGVVEAVVLVSVISPPGFIITPPVLLNAPEGNHLSIPCAAVGSPVPDLRWVHTVSQKYFTHSASDSRVHVSDKGSLYFAAVRPEDSGVYECRASSPAGLTRSLTSLEVVSNIKLIPALFGSLSHNRLHIRFAKHFSTVRVVCERPLPLHLASMDVGLRTLVADTSIMWHYNGKPIKLSQRLFNRTFVESSGSLLISNFRLADSGNYTCVSYNGLSHRYAQWNVEVIISNYGDHDASMGIVQQTDLPDSPLGFQLIGRGDTWLVFHWNNTLHSDDIGYQLFYMPAVFNVPIPIHSPYLHLLDNLKSHDILTGQHLPQVEHNQWLRTGLILQNTERVSGLIPDTGYWFELRKVNRFGLSAGSPIGKIVYTLQLSSGIDMLNNTQMTGGYPNLLAGGGSAVDFQELKSAFNSISFRNILVRSLTSTEFFVSWKTHAPDLILKQVDGFRINVRRVPMSRCLATVTSSPIDSSTGLVDISVAIQSINSLEPNALKWPHCSLHSDLLIEQVLRMSGIQIDSVYPDRDTNVISASFLSTTNPLSEAVVGNLVPFTCYEVEVEAYKDDLTYGRLWSRPSRSELALTLDARPSHPPPIVDVHWLLSSVEVGESYNKSSKYSSIFNGIRIAWKPMDLHMAHGALVGYVIHIHRNNDLYRSVHVSPDVHFKELFDFDPDIEHTVYLSGINCRGEGVRSPGFRLPPLSSSDSQSPTKSNSNYLTLWKLPKWSFGLIGAFIFWLLIGLIVPFVSRRALVICRSRVGNTSPYCESDPQFHANVDKYNHFCGLRWKRAYVRRTPVEKPCSGQANVSHDELRTQNGGRRGDVQMHLLQGSQEICISGREYRPAVASNSTSSSGVIFTAYKVDQRNESNQVNCRDADVYANTDPSDVSNPTSSGRHNSTPADSCGSSSQNASAHIVSNQDTTASPTVLNGIQSALLTTPIKNIHGLCYPANTTLLDLSKFSESPNLHFSPVSSLNSGGTLESQPSHFVILGPVQTPNGGTQPNAFSLHQYHPVGQTNGCLPGQYCAESEVAYASCNLAPQREPTNDMFNTQTIPKRDVRRDGIVCSPPTGLVMSNSLADPNNIHQHQACVVVTGNGGGFVGHVYNNNHNHLSDTSSSGGGTSSAVIPQQPFCGIPPPPCSPPPPPPVPPNGWATNRRTQSRTMEHRESDVHILDGVSDCFYASGGLYTEAEAQLNTALNRPACCTNGNPVTTNAPCHRPVVTSTIQVCRYQPGAKQSPGTINSSSVINRCPTTLSPTSRTVSRTPMLGTGLVNAEAMVMVHDLQHGCGQSSVPYQVKNQGPFP